MTTVPGRAPYKEDEDFTPLRKPKNFTFSTNLSVNAKEFVPSGLYQQQQQQQPQQQQASSSGYFNDQQVQQQEQQFYSNNFQQPQTSFSKNHYQNHHHQQHQQQQNYQQQSQYHKSNYHYQNASQQQPHQSASYNMTNMVNALTTSVQDRLKINSNNTDQQQQQSQQQQYSGNNFSGGLTSNNQYNHNQNYNNSNNSTFNNFKQPNFQQMRFQQNHQHSHHHQPQFHQQQQQQQHHNKHRHGHGQGQSSVYGATHRNYRSHLNSAHGGGGGPSTSSNSSNSNHSNSSNAIEDYNGSGAAASTTLSEVEKIALDYLQTVIQCLNHNPGQFDTLATRFLTIFEGMENNAYVLSIAMEDIFKESIENPNFRYMGAKLYNLLHMLDLKKDSLFQVLLQCKLDYHKEEVREYMQRKQHTNVCNTALFLAELYMQLRGDDTRIRLIAENIVYSLKQLLLSESVENIRCVCLTLKLAGYDLTADCPADMKEIIGDLDKCNQSNPGKYPLAANVISLQKNNWGRRVETWNTLTESTTVSGVLPTPVEPLRISDEPIFYGPDGKELTAEESDFLAMSGDGVDTDADGLGDEDYIADLDIDYDPEMDEETEKDYVEFCKLNQNK